MKSENSFLKQLAIFIPQWVEEQKKELLKLTIYQRKNKTGIKIYLSPLEFPQKYSLEKSQINRLKLLRGYNILLLDENIDEQSYIKLHTATSSISKIQGISRVQSLAYILQVYLLIIDFSRERKNDISFLKEIRKFMLDGTLSNKKPLFRMNNILEVWLSMGALFLEGFTYHPDSFRIHPIYTMVPPIWLTDFEYKDLKKDKDLEIKKPIYTGTEFYAEIKERIPQIEDNLRKVFRVAGGKKIDPNIGNTIEANTPYMNIDECSEYTRIKKNTLYQLTSRKQIPHSKLGRSLIFYKNDIDKWIADPSRKIFTREEIENLEKRRDKSKRKRSAVRTRNAPQ
ncbi:MAG: helix-turn-helix domain-containing protein [Candidatus Cloacimonetes bacterium]|nr:helix-turn-helix domain-containing protein [Candidatus Cloacimonadota bacterium]